MDKNKHISGDDSRMRRTLFAIIAKELAKDPDDIDLDLIQECSDFEAELDPGDLTFPVERDPSGTLICPGHPKLCHGSDHWPQFDLCCDNCDHYLACFPEDQKEVDEALEDLRDLKAAEQAMAEHEKDPKTYTFDEVLEELGITREELDAMPAADLELDVE